MFVAFDFKNLQSKTKKTAELLSVIIRLEKYFFFLAC